MSDTWARRAPLTGVVAAVLFLLSVIIGGVSPPSVDASASEVANYWDDGAQIVSGILGALGTLFLVFFASTLRSRMRAAESLSNLVLVGGAFFALGLAIFGGIAFTLTDLAGSDKQIDPGALQALNALNEDMFVPSVIGLSVFYLSTGLAVLATGALPRWFGWVSVALGVIAILGPGGLVALFLGIPWLFVAGIMLMQRDSAPGATHQGNPVGTS
jgi:hypothetical protein